MKIKASGYSGTAIPFQGSNEQAELNYATHDFSEEGRCLWCDCRPWGVWANHPCGNANMERTTRYELPEGGQVWIQTRVYNGQEVLVGVFSKCPD